MVPCFVLLFVLFGFKTTLCEEMGICSVFVKENAHQVDKVFTDSVISTTKSGSVRRCAVECLQHITCMAYFYRQNTTECRLAKMNIPEDSGMWISEQGWRFFQAYQMSCPPHTGFSLSRELQFCYRYFTTPKKVLEAKAACVLYGGHLLRIDSQSKQDHLAKYLDFFNENLIYIQGSDSVQEGSWSYDDGKLMTYFNWNPASPFGHDARDYIVMTKSSSCGWEETDGETPGAFLCELVI